VLREHLAIPADEVIVLGVAVGYADPSAPVNRAQPPRAALEENVTLRP
jgi:hypothetical protein